MASTFRVATLETAFTADTSNVDAAVKSVRGETEALDGQVSEAQIVADATDALRSLDDVKGELDEVSATDAEALVSVDTTEATANLEDVDRNLADLGDVETTPVVEADTDQVIRRLDDVKVELDDVGDTKVEPTIDINTRGAVQGLDRAREGLDEVKDSGRESAQELASSFDGSADSIVDAFAEVSSEAGFAFGPAGALAGLATAAGAGALFAYINEQAESVEETVSGLFDAMVDQGSAAVSETLVMGEVTRLIEEQGDAWEYARQLNEDYGIDTGITLRALAGDTSAQGDVTAELAEETDRLRESSKDTNGVLDETDVAYLRAKSSGQEWRQTIRDTNSDVGQATQRYRAHKSASEGVAGQARNTTDDVRGLNREFRDTPKRVHTDVTADVSQARRNARDVVRDINRMAGEIDVNADTSQARAEIDAVLARAAYAALQIGLNVFSNADGRVVDYYANGGLENHVAQIAPAGAWRVWAEPETGGEAYIPLSPSKRSRSMAILDEVADRFGAELVPQANGGVVAAPATAAPSSTTAVRVTPMSTQDIQRLGDYILAASTNVVAANNRMQDSRARYARGTL